MGRPWDVSDAPPKNSAGAFYSRFQQRRQRFLSAALVHEWVALEEVEDGLWSIWFYDLVEGRLDERQHRITV